MQFRAAIISSLIVVAATAADQYPSPDEKTASALIDELGENKDLVALEVLAGKIEAQWLEKDARAYGRLMRQLLGVLRSENFEDQPRAFRSCRALALRALQHVERFSIHDHLRLAQQVDVGLSLGKEKWAEQRAQAVAARVRAWRRALAAIDWTYDPAQHRFTPYADVPEGVLVGYPGMPPERIDDPVLRAQYEVNIAEHNARVRRHSQQQQARQTVEIARPGFTQYMVYMYSREPDNADFEKQLELCEFDAKTRQEMRTKLEAAIKANKQ